MEVARVVQGRIRRREHDFATPEAAAGSCSGTANAVADHVAATLIIARHPARILCQLSRHGIQPPVAARATAEKRSST
jgi:hypothetical protein